jgi:perosamine synthetase
MFWNTAVAQKYKMSSMQAALGLAQLERIDELLDRKREIFEWYKEELSDVEGVSLNPESPSTTNSYWMITVVLDKNSAVDRDCLMKAMKERSVDCRPFFYPLSSLPAYQHLDQARKARARNHVSYDICPRGLNLPSPLNLTKAQAEYVCGAFREALLPKGV